MKRLFLVLTAMCFVALSNAQVPGLSFGPKIGVNLSQVTTNLTNVTDQMKTGYDLGAFLRIGQKCYFQPELLYSTSGVKFSNVPVGTPSDINVKSINVPLMVGARLVNLKVVNVRVLAGPVASFVVNKDVSYNGVIDQTRQVSIKDSKWGLQFGAGVDVLMFTLDLRYNYDLNGQFSQQASSFDWKKQAVNLSLGWKIF